MLGGESSCCHPTWNGASFPALTRVVNLTPHRFINVHLLNLLDGRPHEVPIRKVLSQNWGHNGDCLVTSSQISGSKIALLVKFVGVAEAEAESLKELIAWDWKTGQVVSALFFGGRVV